MKNFQQKEVTGPAKDLKLNAPGVSEYMTKKLITFRPEQPISEVIDALLKHRITGGPVLNAENQVVGLIDDKDCLKVLFAGAYYNHPVHKDTVADYMSNVMKTISVNDDIIDVGNIFISTPYKRLVVLDDDGRLVGQISRRDILRAIKELKLSTW